MHFASNPMSASKTEPGKDERKKETSASFLALCNLQPYSSLPSVLSDNPVLLLGTSDRKAFFEYPSLPPVRPHHSLLPVTLDAGAVPS